MPYQRLRIDFTEPPKKGMVVYSANGQAYTVVRTEPYVRKDGMRSSIITWRTTCASKEGKPHTFTLTTGLYGYIQTTKCEHHRMTRADYAKEAVRRKIIRHYIEGQ